MRTIPEVAEDVKSVLNNIERTEECTGETLVDINELVDEILAINCYKDKPKTNADKIRAMSDEELAEFLIKFQHCDICDEQLEMHCTGECVDNVAKWLQAEVEG